MMQCFWFVQNMEAKMLSKWKEKVKGIMLVEILL